MTTRSQIGQLLLAAAFMALATGCDALAGQGRQPALYKIAKNQRVLVLVDVYEGVTPPPAFATTLGDKIGLALFSNKAVDHLVPQDQILSLQQKDAAAYKNIPTADIARETGAAIVVQVKLTQLQTQLTTDGTVVWGDATAYVKVFNKDGQKLWPGQATGAPIVAHVDPVLVAERDVPRVLKDLSEQLTMHIGRIFYEWQPEKGEMSPHSF